MIVAAAQATRSTKSRRLRIAVPGTLTTAYLTLKLFAPDIETVTVPFDKIIPAVVAGEFDAGLIIHEGQLTYANDGLVKAPRPRRTGGASRPAFRCLSAATPSAARSATRRC